MDKGRVHAILKKVRESNPSILSMTNIPAANFSANGLLALGAKPIWANAVEEAADMAKLANAVVLNIGTLNRESVEAMIISGTTANVHDVPVVFDLVGVGSTQYRTQVSHQLMKEIKMSVIRGNAKEIAALIEEKWEIKGGVEGKVNENVSELAVMAAKKLDSVVFVTGKYDLISDGVSIYVVRSCEPILKKVAGSGCLLSDVVGGFSAVEKNYLEAVVSALVFYSVAAEIAANKTDGQGPGSFQIEFLNQLSNVASSEIDLYGSFEKK